ncbi:hypothetical protein [Fimbriiglobus ruber]|uniref:hypothetical protein n=1 Tax=Fimbriiglobus ruber TaxID=1908690 RepID=UPI00117B22AD|nr:hypothetical protein [Fimbriiglobus ruber]
MTIRPNRNSGHSTRTDRTRRARHRTAKQKRRLARKARKARHARRVHEHLPQPARSFWDSFAPAVTAPTFRRFVPLARAAILTIGCHTACNLLRTLGTLAPDTRPVTMATAARKYSESGPGSPNGCRSKLCQSRRSRPTDRSTQK